MGARRMAADTASAARDLQFVMDMAVDADFQALKETQGKLQAEPHVGQDTLREADSDVEDDSSDALDGEDGRSEHGVQGKRCSWLDPEHWHSHWSHRIDCSKEPTFVSPETRRPGSIIPGRPFEGFSTIESFNFSERVLPLCKAGDLTGAMRFMPMNLPSDVSPRDLCVTQENIPGYFDLSRYAPYRERITRQLSATLDEAFHGPTPFGSCAVVGSSGNLLKRSYGEEIDLHEKTWRFNLAPAGRSYAPHVGTATHFRVLNNKKTRIYSLNGRVKEGSSHIEEVFWESGSTLIVSRVEPGNMSTYLPMLRDHMQKTDQGRGMELAVADRRFMYHANHVFDVFRRCDAISRGIPMPTKLKSASSGLMATLSALHLCKHVSVFGVGEPKLKEGDFFHYYMDHYFHGSHGTADFAAHEFNIEHEMFDEMAKIGLIRHCTVNGCKGRPLPPEVKDRAEV